MGYTMLFFMLVGIAGGTLYLLARDQKEVAAFYFYTAIAGSILFSILYAIVRPIFLANGWVIE